MHQIVFVPIMVFLATGLTAGTVSAWIEFRAQPRPRAAQKFRPVLVHDKGSAPLLRSTVKQPAPRYRDAMPIRLVINGG
jgi:hypothetical protein